MSRTASLLRPLLLNRAMPVVLILFLAGLVGWQTLDVLQASDMVRRSVHVIQLVDGADAAFESMRSAVRLRENGTGQAAVEQYGRARGLLDDRLHALLDAEAGRPARGELLTLSAELEAWRREVEPALAAGRAAPSGARARERRLHRIRTTMEAFRASEEAALVAHQAAFRREAMLNCAMAMGALVLGALFFVLWGARQVREIDRTYREALLDREAQSVRLTHQADELRQQRDRLDALYAELQAANDGLEQKVAERTRALSEQSELLKRTMLEAEEANRAKSLFLANMSHELRTPLNAIIGYADLLQEEVREATPEAMDADLQKISDAGRHLLGMISGILDLSKIEAGKMDLYLETVEPMPLVNEVVALMQVTAQRRRNTLAIHVEGELGALHTDVTKLRQCLLNLLSNACKFTEGGTVTLTVRPAPGGMAFEVRDTGIGMSPEQLTRLFTVFSQADASTTRQYGGTGLGLALTHHFVEMLGGHIAVSSTPGEGTVFTMTLPSDAGPARAGLARQPLAPIEGDGPRVLVIDDDPVVRELMSRLLAKEGCTVITAEHGRDGLALARSHRPDLITLDVMMPGMDGWSVLTELKSDPELVDVPVVILSMINEREFGLTLGAADYLVKPIDARRLQQVLGRHAAATEVPRVLVVDDQPANREMLGRTLQKEGYAVREAANGLEALAQLAVEVPDVILLDLMMPEMDGFEVIERLRAHEAWCRVPIVVVTARTLSPEEQAWLHARVERVLSKGTFDPAALRAEVRRHLPAAPGP